MDVVERMGKKVGVGREVGNVVVGVVGVGDEMGDVEEV